MRAIAMITAAVCGMFLSQTSLAQNKEVIAAKETLEAAFNSGNIQGIRSGTTTDHIAIAPHWELFSQAEQLATIPDLKVQSYEMYAMKTMQLTDDVVVLTFQAHIAGTYMGKKLTPHVRVVETWVKRGDKWLQATYQETQVDQRNGS